MSTRTIRARVHAGWFEPVEPEERISIPEGTEVSLRVEEPVVGTKEAVLAAVRRSPPLTPEEGAELRASIAAGTVAARTEGVFDEHKE